MPRSKVAILDCLKGGETAQRCQNFNCLKPELAKIRVFAPTMDNMTGKEKAVLIMIYYRLCLHAGWFIYLAISLI